MNSKTSEIPYVDFGGNGETIHFAHANGFPPETYASIIENLTTEYKVIGMELRPLWPQSNYRSFKNWESGADDLIAFLDQQQISGIIGMGHSLGGILTLIASVKRPDLFKRIVLVEPVFLPAWAYGLTRTFPFAILKRINPVVKQTLVRTNEWNSRTETYQQFRSKRVFSKIPDKELWDYVNAGTTLSQHKVTLKFPREWEAQIYMTFSSPWKFLEQTTKPLLVIRGETSETIRDAVWKRFKRERKQEELIEMKDLGHLLPLEAPKETANHILNFLKKN